MGFELGQMQSINTIDVSSMRLPIVIGLVCLESIHQGISHSLATQQIHALGHRVTCAIALIQDLTNGLF